MFTDKEKGEVKVIQGWLNTSRFAGIKREYEAIDIWKLRCKYQSSYASNTISRKLFNLLTEHKKNKTFKTVKKNKARPSQGRPGKKNQGASQPGPASEKNNARLSDERKW